MSKIPRLWKTGILSRIEMHVFIYHKGVQFWPLDNDGITLLLIITSFLLQTRLAPGALDNLHSMLEWSGLVPDEGMYRKQIKGHKTITLLNWTT